MDNSKEIFSLALGLNEPWSVGKIGFEEVPSGKELHIHISFTRGFKFKSDDGEIYAAHDTVDRTWQHLNFFQHKCFLHAKVPRVVDKKGKVITQAVPWARKGSGFTLLFEAYSMLLIENEMPVNKAAKIVGVYPNRLWRVFSYWIGKAHNGDKVDNLSKIGFDETSRKKGHNYVTTCVDLDQRRVLFASEGKGSGNIKEAVEYLESKSVDIKEINQVCIDMSPAFISGCYEHLPDASITFDKFHIVKEVNKAMDELRKLERKGNDMLKGHKYTFLKSKLTPQIKHERDLLMEYYPKLGEGYRLVQMFRDFWDIEQSEEAESYLAFWCDLAIDSKIQPFIKAANTIKAHWSGIVNYIKSKVNNGILEGLNSKIQLAKKRARGYRNINNFINMIYFTCGKLKFDYPLYLA
jgi:transposase